MEELGLCPTCRRHVKHEDARCPFCSAAMPARAGIVAMGALVVGVGLSMAACEHNVVALYAGPPGGYGPGGSSTTGGSGGTGGDPSTGTAGAAGSTGGLDGGIGGAYGPPPPPFGDG